MVNALKLTLSKANAVLVARKVQVGYIVIIMSYALMDFEEAKTFKPWVIFPDSATNKLV